MRPTHAIIIPHRGREQHLRLCLRRLADVTLRHRDAARVEVIVVNELQDNGRDVTLRMPSTPYALRVVHGFRPGKLFNKPYLQNIGIEEARGDVLTFLDADALVADEFFSASDMALSPRITKVCYRVIRLPADSVDYLHDARYLAHAFDRYHREEFFDRRAHEGYCAAEVNMPCGMPVFGNSHFSIAREKLGALRFNEEYEGAGFEDMWLNRELERVWGEEYQAIIFTDGDHAVFSIDNPREDDWWDTETNQRNMTRYRNS